jgi:ferredoxin
MAAKAQSLVSYFDSEIAKVLGACTACGKCVEVCPVVPYAGLKDADPKAVTARRGRFSRSSRAADRLFRDFCTRVQRMR